MMRMSCRERWLATLLALVVAPALTAGCERTGDGEATEPVTTRDSAGVRIVEYAGSLDTPAAIVLSAEPQYRIGWDDGGRLFENVEAGALGSDGRAVIADGGRTQQLVLLGSTGSVEAVLGARGDGPGEFRNLSSLALLDGDSIAALDPGSRRLSLFGPSGFGRSVPLEGAGILRLLGADQGEHAVLLGMPLAVVRGRLYETAFLSVPLVTVDLASDRVDTIASADWDQSLEPQFRGRTPFMAGGFASTSGNGFVVGRGDIPEIRWIDRDGQVRQISRWTVTPVPVTDAMHDAYEARMIQAYMDAGRDQASIDYSMSLHREYPRLTGEPLPLFGIGGGMPPWGGVIGDPLGYVWIAAYAEPRTGPPTRYWVVGPNGAWMGAVEMPPGLRVLAIGESRLLGVETNPLGVQAVVSYAIERPQSAPR